MALKKSKYRSIRETVDGVTFASRREARRYGELKLLQRLGQIRGLELQPQFPLVVNGTKVCTYIADAAYFEGNTRVVEDVKSAPTKTPVYRLKVKLLRALNPGIDHREIM